MYDLNAGLLTSQIFVTQSSSSHLPRGHDIKRIIGLTNESGSAFGIGASTDPADVRGTSFAAATRTNRDQLAEGSSHGTALQRVGTLRVHRKQLLRKRMERKEI